MTAYNTEVYAEELRRQRRDGSWERVETFPPMNLKWSNIGAMYFPRISPQMGKHCDVGHIPDPARRYVVAEENHALGLTNLQTSLTFDVIAAPFHLGHIVPPGSYQLNILIAAENAGPMRKTVALNLPGPWYPNEGQMLRDGVGITVN